MNILDEFKNIFKMANDILDTKQIKTEFRKIKSYKELVELAKDHIVIDVHYDYSNYRIILHVRHQETKDNIFLDITDLKYPYFYLEDESKWDAFVDKKYLQVKFTEHNLGDLVFSKLKTNLTGKRFFNTRYGVNDKIILLFRQFQNFDIEKTASYNSLYDILFFDIEVLSSKDNEFPDENVAEYPISSISMFDKDKKLIILINKSLFQNIDEQEIRNKIDVVYSKDYELSSKDVIFKYFDSEVDMIKEFCNNVRKHNVVTAWNIQFDINYIYNRMTKLGLDQSLLSPINSKMGKPKSNTFYRIPGIITFDLLEIYKKYTKKYFSYKLDAIAERELGLKKVEFEGSLNQLLREDPNTYILYSLIDSYLIYKIAETTGLLNLILSVKDDASISYQNVLHDTFIILAVLYQYAHKDGKAIASTFYSPEKVKFPGAFVREPKTGLLHWVIDSDASSMYPSIMISLNISPETLYAQILEPKEIIEKFIFEDLHDDYELKVRLIKKNIVTKVKAGVIRKKIYEDKMYKIAPSGTIYINNSKQVGYVPLALDTLLKERKYYKKLMFEYKGKDPVLHKKYKIIQSVKKILANAMYGALGAKEFIFYYPDMAKSITLTGQYMNKFVSGILDYCFDVTINKLKSDELLKSIEYVDSFTSTKFIKRSEGKQNYVFYSDTDSSFIHMEDILIERFHKKYGNELTKDDIKNDLRNIMVNDVKKLTVDEIKSTIHEFVDNINVIIHDYILKEYAKRLNCPNDHRFSYKTEFIFRSVYFTQKKHYIQYIIENEGNPTDEISSMNIGIKSTYSPMTNDMIKELMIILVKRNADRKEIINFIDKWRNKFRKAYDEERLAFACIPAPFNKDDISKYDKLPDNILGMMLYNMLTRTNTFKPRSKGFKVYIKGIDYRMLGLTKAEYTNILREFNKKYIKNNSNAMYNRITFPVDFKHIPEWIIVDTRSMMDKMFATPIQHILKPLGITVELEKRVSIFDLINS